MTPVGSLENHSTHQMDCDDSLSSSAHSSVVAMERLARAFKIADKSILVLMCLILMVNLTLGSIVIGLEGYDRRKESEVCCHKTQGPCFNLVAAISARS